jgi:flagellar hook assembly protein FlgD
MALPIDPVTGLQNSTYSARKNPGAELSQVDFMQLIIAQMRNQNPLEPQKDTDFMAQMAQFEALSQMRSVADSMKVLQGIGELNSAASMIGKNVTGRLVDGTAVIRDAVARELFGVSYAELHAEGRVQVDADGRVAQARAEADYAGREVSGVVDRVAVGPDGVPMLVVGGRVIDLFTVSEVR